MPIDIEWPADGQVPWGPDLRGGLDQLLAYVNSLGGGDVESVNGKSGVVTLTSADIGAASSGDVSTLQGEVDSLESSVSSLGTRTTSLETTVGGLPTYTDLRSKTGIVYVNDFPKVGAYDSSRIQNAIDYAVTNGFGEVRFASQIYELNAPVDIPPVSGLTLSGTRGKTIFRRPPEVSGITATAFRTAPVIGNTVEQLTFRGLSFVGGISNLTDLGDNRARSEGTTTLSEGGVTIQWYDGRLDAGIQAFGRRTEYWNNAGDASNPYGVVRNIVVQDCDFIGMRGLPVFFQGVDGYARVEGCWSLRCLDLGWIYCESAQYIRNRSDFSMDNGASLSRGCYEAIATNNSVYKPWFNGIWIGGFPAAQPTTSAIAPKGSWGPAMSIVSDNVIRQPGQHGIYAPDCNGRITAEGNTMISVHMPMISVKDDSSGIGICILPYGTSEIPLAVTLTGNTIDGAARGGIMCTAARVFTAVGNTMRSMGLATNPDGTARAGGVAQRFGISYGTGIAITGGKNVTFLANSNSIIDNRATALTYYPIYMPTGGYRMVANNLTTGCLQPVTVGTDAV